MKINKTWCGTSKSRKDFILFNNLSRFTCDFYFAYLHGRIFGVFSQNFDFWDFSSISFDEFSEIASRRIEVHSSWRLNCAIFPYFSKFSKLFKNSGSFFYLLVRFSQIFSTMSWSWNFSAWVKSFIIFSNKTFFTYLQFSHRERIRKKYIYIVNY